MEQRKKIAAWRSVGDCSICLHAWCCRKECEAHENRVNALIKKALLLDAVKKGGMQDG